MTVPARLQGLSPRVLFLLAASLVHEGATGQLYSVDVRPSGLSYRVGRTDHFEVIYQTGYENEAARVGYTLESSLPRSRELIGRRRNRRVPVVMNAFSDRSNGFVTPFPYKMEIEIPSLKGQSLSPHDPSWLSVVSRHELVHSAHADFGSGIGIVGLARLFSPDLARAMNLLVPRGVAEGVAVFMESEGPGHVGRLNHSLFEMEFRAAVAQRRPWSLAQMLERPRFSVPVDRYYHGGAHLYSYLYRLDGGRSIRRAQLFHYRIPLFGYGVSLWAGSGRPPWIIGRDFRLSARQAELERQLRLGEVTAPDVVSSTRGSMHRRPQWLSDSEVVVYMTGYNLVAGFHRVDVTTGRRTRIASHWITEDVHFSLSPTKDRILFSRYVTDPVVTSRSVARLFELDVSSGRARSVSESPGVFTASVSRRGETWASVNSGEFSRLAVVGGGPTYPAVAVPSRTSIRLLQWSPKGDTLAAVVHRNGAQGLYLVVDRDGRYDAIPLLVHNSAAVLDASWLPDGSGLVFSADAGDVANVYAHVFAGDSIVQLTNARYGAMEPSVSPDGSTLAYVNYEHETLELVTLPFDVQSATRIPRAQFAHFERHAADQAEQTVVADSIFVESPRPYRAGRYLAPRGFFPIVDYSPVDTQAGDVKPGLGIGAAIVGADPLQRWSYVGAAYVQTGKLWGQLAVQTGLSVLRPTVSVFRSPSTRVVQSSLENGGTVVRRVGYEEEGARVRGTLPLVLSSNVYSSSMAFGLEGRYSRSRIFGPGGDALTAYENRASIMPSATAAFRTRADHRDIRTSSGVVIGATSLVDVWSEQEARKALLMEGRVFTRSIPGTGGSFSLYGGLLWQNHEAIYDLDLFLPRGLEETFLEEGTFVKYGLDLVQPVAFVDNGLVILPVYLKSIYAFGFAESVRSADNVGLEFDSVGGGLGVQARFFYLFDFDLRFGVTWLPGSGKVEPVFR